MACSASTKAASLSRDTHARSLGRQGPGSASLVSASAYGSSRSEADSPLTARAGPPLSPPRRSATPGAYSEADIRSNQGNIAKRWVSAVGQTRNQPFGPRAAQAC